MEALRGIGTRHDLDPPGPDPLEGAAQPRPSMTPSAQIWTSPRTRSARDAATEAGVGRTLPCRLECAPSGGPAQAAVLAGARAWHAPIGSAADIERPLLRRRRSKLGPPCRAPRRRAPRTAGPARRRDAEVGFRGRRRSDEARASRIPDARLHRRRRVSGHALVENRDGPIMDAAPTRAAGTAERVAPAGAARGRRPRRRTRRHLRRRPGLRRRRLRNGGARAGGHAPLARNAAGRRSAVDGRPPRHEGRAAGRRRRKRIEAFSGRAEAAPGARRTTFPGLDRSAFALAAAACDLVRLPRRLAA